MSVDFVQAEPGLSQAVAAPRIAAWRVFVRERAAIAGLALLAVVVLVSIFGPLVYRTDPYTIVSAPLLPPGDPSAPPLGTDKLGRDVLAGILVGGRVTLVVGGVAAVISMVIGVMTGGLAGYFGGWVDSMLMWVTELFMVIPVVLFAMVVLTLYAPTSANVAIAIGITSWPTTARVARGEFLRLRNMEFVRAARWIGSSDARIMSRVILPNAAPPLIVIASLVVGVAMLFQAGLSFLGLGDPNQMSWGLMLGENRDQILQAWWPTTLPGLAIFVAVLSVGLLADGLNGVLNPRRRQTR